MSPCLPCLFLPFVAHIYPTLRSQAYTFCWSLVQMVDGFEENRQIQRASLLMPELQHEPAALARLPLCDPALPRLLVGLLAESGDDRELQVRALVPVPDRDRCCTHGSTKRTPF